MKLREIIMKEAKKKSVKAQTWSVDMIIGVVLFLILLVIVYALIATTPFEDSQLRRDADKIVTKLDADKTPDDGLPKILKGNLLTRDALAQLSEENYADLKNKLGVVGDFCIVLIDENSAIINISNNMMSFGNNNVEIGRDADGQSIFCGS